MPCLPLQQKTKLRRRGELVSWPSLTALPSTQFLYLSGLFFFFFLQGMAHTHWSQDIVEAAWVYRVWIRQTFPDVPPMSPSFRGLRTTFPEPHPYGGLWQSQSRRGPSWSGLHASHAGLGPISAGETCVYGGRVIVTVPVLRLLRWGEGTLGTSDGVKNGLIIL